MTVLQVAIDIINLERALKIANLVIDGGANWVEVGTPLIKKCGVRAIKAFRKAFEGVLVADMKIIDAGEVEVKMAANAGADIITVAGCAPVETLLSSIKAAKKLGKKIMVDMIGVKRIIKRAVDVERYGADYIALHTGIDEQQKGLTPPFKELPKIHMKVQIPIAIAGGITLDSARIAIDCGAYIIIVGATITRSTNPFGVTKEFINVLRSYKPSGEKSSEFRE